MPDQAVVLILGSGGREHALAWKIGQSKLVKKIFVSPGNGGTATLMLPDRPENFIENVILASHDDVLRFCESQSVKLVVVGPEDYLAAGIADQLKAAGISCFGPSASAARIEASKAFSKDFMCRYNIPTAKYQVFTDPGEATKYLRTCDFPVVIKASGLAAGKGVVLPSTKEEALTAIEEIMVRRSFGSAGDEVVIEELLVGEEASFLAFTDGTTVVPMPPAQDHKRAFDGDQGLNTGGMGAFAPTPSILSETKYRVLTDILQPAVDGLKKEGCPFVGVLYAGVMLTKEGPKTLEFNCRFGDPETQVLLPLLKSDLFEIALACVSGSLDSCLVEFESELVAATVVAASAGYPGSYTKGKVISGLHDAERSGASAVVVFHAGTSIENGNKNLLVTSGGRVLAVTAVAPSLQQALQRSYSALEHISFDGMFYRNDIGCKKLPKVRLGVLGSTRGTDLQAIIAAIANKELNAEVTLAISNLADAYILERCKKHEINAIHIPSRGKTREQFDREVLSAFEAAGGVDLVLLIGFMRIVSPILVTAYKGRMINVHPSLLPEFAGGMDADVHQAVLKAGKKVSGCTIHMVDVEVDQGEILIQKQCAIDDFETPDSLKSKVQALEGAALVEAIRLFQQGRLRKARKAATYSGAGVNMERGDLLVEKIKPFAKATSRPGADSELGGFGALFDLAAAGYDSKETLLVSGTDGVGTKLLLAQQAKMHGTIGIDLVAMCVNDVLAQGAEPLFFLDYFATGKLQVEEAASVISGIASGCKESGCALVGGETAEMPGMYGPSHYDLAGFAVGAVRRSDVLPKYDQIRPETDVAIGLASSGIHSNGFSLVRHLISHHGIDVMTTPSYRKNCGDSRIIDDLLAPTRLYVQPVLPLMKRGLIKAAAHITGGGITENLPRVIPNDVAVELDASKWTMPPVMRWLACELGQMESREILRTFNCGLGMILIVDVSHAADVIQSLKLGGFPDVCVIGKVLQRSAGVDQVQVKNVERLLEPYE